MTGFTEFRFRVKSLHPAKDSQKLALELAKSGRELEQHLKVLRPEYANISIDGGLEAAVPFDPATAYLILKIVGGSIASGFLTRLGEDIYEFLKDRIRDGRVDPPGR